MRKLSSITIPCVKGFSTCLLAVTVVLACVYRVYADPVPIDKGTMSQIDQCVESTFNAFVSVSKSTCVGISKYYDSGGNINSSSQNNYYDIAGNEWAGYRYKRGTEKVFHEGGACIHEMSASIINDTRFLCHYYTKGCGATKGGGHVRGYCSVDIEYVPRAGDVVAIKRYCLSKFSGGSVLPTPLSYPVGCQLP